MEEEIINLTNSIDNNCLELIKNNKFLINGFKVRLIKRLLTIFNNYKIPFNKEILESLITDYLINNLKGSNNELCNSYKKVLYKYFDIINEYYNTHDNSKEKIKYVTTIFIKKIYSEDNPILNEDITISFMSELKLKVLVYDNYLLNKELENRIKSDTKEVICEIMKNNKDYVINSMKLILSYVIGGTNE